MVPLLIGFAVLYLLFGAFYGSSDNGYIPLGYKDYSGWPKQLLALATWPLMVMSEKYRNFMMFR